MKTLCLCIALLMYASGVTTAIEGYADGAADRRQHNKGSNSEAGEAGWDSLRGNDRAACGIGAFDSRNKGDK